MNPNENEYLKFAADIFGGGVQSVEVLRGGANNFVCRCHNTVLKISGLGDPNRMMREVEALQWLSAIGVSVPEIYDVGRRDGLSYFLMSYIQGRLLSHAWSSLKEEERAAVISRVADILIAMHSAPMIPELPAFPYEHIVDGVSRLTQQTESIEFRTTDFGKAHAHRLMRIFTPLEVESRRSSTNLCLLSSAPNVFTHGDFSTGNLMIDEFLNVYAIDFDSVFSAPAIRDTVGLIYEMLDWESGDLLLIRPEGKALFSSLIKQYSRWIDDKEGWITYLKGLFIQRITWFLERAIGLDNETLLKRGEFYYQFFFQQSEEVIIAKLLGP